jgi:hypothetical protein
LNTTIDHSNVHEFEAYLREVFQQLARFKKFPKYQLERRVDGFIGVFLTEILKAKWGWETELVAPEFPIKKKGSNRSTNIDYLLHRSENASAKAAWIFVELKTDSGSIGDKQLRAYRQAQKLGMTRLRTQLKAILKATKDKDKYKHLFATLEPFTLDHPIELLYLVPSKNNLPGDVPKLTFKEISKQSIEGYSGTWRFFSTLLLGEIDP